MLTEGLQMALDYLFQVSKYSWLENPIVGQYNVSQIVTF